MDLFRFLLYENGLSKRIWAEALSTATYVLNLVTSRSLPPKVTRHHLWNRSPLIVTHMRLFDSQCCYTSPKHKLQKLDTPSRSAIFFDILNKLRRLKQIYIETKKEVVSTNVTFDESISPHFEPNQTFFHVNHDPHEQVVYLERDASLRSANENVSSTVEADDAPVAETVQDTPVDDISSPGNVKDNVYEDHVDLDV